MLTHGVDDISSCFRSAVGEFDLLKQNDVYRLDIV